MSSTLVISGKKNIVLPISLWLMILSCIPQNEAYAFLDPVIKLFRYVALAWSILIFTTTRQYLNKKLLLVFGFLCWILVSSLINLTSIVDTFKLLYPIFTCVVLTQYIIEKDKLKGFKALAIFFCVLMVIQAFTLATHCFGDIYVGAWQGNYFFGIRVNVSFILPYAIGLNLVYAKIDKKWGRLSFAITLISAIYFAVFEAVSTALVVIATILGFSFFTYIYKFKRHMLKTVIFLTIAFSAGFAFLGSKTHIFEWLLVGILKEDVTLDGRTILWEQAFDYLKGLHWLYGYGYKHNFLFKISWWFAADHPHNEYLEMLFCYGMIGVCIYIKMLVKQFKSLVSINNKEVRDAMFATLLSIVIMHIASHNYMAVFPYIFYVVFVNLNGILEEENNVRYRSQPRT